MEVLQCTPVERSQVICLSEAARWIRGAAEIHESVRQSGYRTVDAASFILSLKCQESFDRFSDCWNSLVADEYLPKSYGTRSRRHGRFSYDPNDSSLRLLPSTSYYQSPNVNALMGGINRTFAPLEDGAVQSEFFRALLSYNVASLQLSPRCGWIINVHFIRIPCTSTQAGYPCPEGVHRDGFDLISIHLINKTNIKGALTTIFDASGNPLIGVTLQHPLDSIYAADSRVMHYTDPFFSEGTDEGHRDMLLLSYDPA